MDKMTVLTRFVWYFNAYKKGLSILKVQLVKVIEIDQHVLYEFVCKA